MNIHCSKYWFKTLVFWFKSCESQATILCCSKVGKTSHIFHTKLCLRWPFPRLKENPFCCHCDLQYRQLKLWELLHARYCAGHLLLFICSVVSNSFATSWTTSCQVPLSTGFPRQEYWNGLPFPAPGVLPDPGIESLCPALAGGFFATWEALKTINSTLPNYIWWVISFNPYNLTN